MPRFVVPPACHNLAEQREAVHRPRAQSGFIQLCLDRLALAEPSLQRLLPLPESGEPVVDERQVGRIKPGHQRFDGAVDLFQFGDEGPRVHVNAMIVPHRLNEPLYRVVNALAILEYARLYLAQHPVFEPVGPDMRGVRTERGATPVSTRADVVRRHDGLAARFLALGLANTPERLATAGAPQHTAQEPTVGVFAAPATLRGSIRGGDLGPVPVASAHECRYCIGDDDPVVFVGHGEATGFARGTHGIGPAITDAEELGPRPAVPDDVAAVCRVLNNCLDTRHLKEASFGTRDACAIEFFGDGTEPITLDAPAEDVADRLHSFRIAEHEPRGARLPGLAERLTGGVGGLRRSMLVADFAPPPAAEAHSVEHGSIGSNDLSVVSERRHATGV